MSVGAGLERRNIQNDKMNLDIKSWLRGNHGNATLLGICPTSEEIVEASIKEASDEGFIPMFVTTPRQVDADRGYTGWSQEELVEFIRSTAEELGYTGPCLIARDHGGPYQSNRDRGRPEVSLDRAMGHAKEMFARDLTDGFGILHIDATEDPTIEETLGLEEVARRTVELLDYIEEVRRGENLPVVYYEVGTEEISGGITEPDSFERFIRLLKSQLIDRGCGQAINQLLFIVGQVGTTMRIDMTNRFNPQLAKTLVDIASRYDLFLKVHYADWLETPVLEQFPKLGVGAVNVGPELASTVIKALSELEKREVQALQRVDENVQPSNIMETIEDTAIERAPWRRFAPMGLETQELEVFAQGHRREIALCVGRYIMKNPEVVKACQKLYENVKRHSPADNPHQFVIDCVRKAIRRYVGAFNPKH